MYERMLNKQEKPTIEEMTAYCGENAEQFTTLNEWLSSNFGTVQTVVFPYGNHYGWGIAHKKKNKFICNVFAENGAFTVMIRMTNKQYEVLYNQLTKYTQEFIDNKYPCGEGGWIQYRAICEEHLEDAKKLLSEKCR